MVERIRALPTREFHAVAFCKIDDDQSLKFIDISWERKDNCSAYDAWIVNGKISNECGLNNGLELCQAVEKMVISGQF